VVLVALIKIDKRGGGLVLIYLVVASPVWLRYSAIDKWPGRYDFGTWFEPGLMGSCAVGVCATLFVHIVMACMLRSTTATSHDYQENS